ncbi:hypothetical protein D046_4611B, partial [Vibrio parahaemolyticus V-223/04]
GKPQVLWG